ncbi:hypothetical protein B0H16DRAFT_1660997 [Mycena metata]|uniref:CxC2-like cysteine cluster KDZ transposase-associated domain-containing protein n=1 Tax=Mycena metata TaxID=1033252 RepID=A0AAD7JPN8_9AGAR|nr:hypothetical protein B0H16DRAFT_1660997 [Mycena metata]
MRFVDTTGIFSRRVRWCRCRDKHGHPVRHDLQLLDACIYPATSDRPTPAFTFNVPDEFTIDALECKTATLTFVAKLCQLTNCVFPSSMLDMYPALMRCLRQYRNLKNFIHAGFAHDSNCARTPGDLGLFCVTCPQIGKNISAAKLLASENLEEYTPQIVADGNFKLDDLKMRNPEDNDVDSTGIGACACAHHGCFYPHSVVGFKVGERQVNMDYTISEVFC